MAVQIGVEAYVAAAQRFAKWSFSTSEERAAVIRVSRALKACPDKESTFIHFL
jgi:hypothetical protein